MEEQKKPVPKDQNKTTQYALYAIIALLVVGVGFLIFKGTSSNPPADNGGNTEKPAEEELAEVEKRLTDEQRNIADAMLAAETDDEVAYKLVNDPVERLKFLKELSSDPALRSRPKSFFASQQETTSQSQPSGDGETVYQRLMKQIKGVPIGPSGHAADVKTSAQPPRKRPKGTLVT